MKQMKLHISYGLALIAAFLATLPVRADGLPDIPPLVITCEEYISKIETNGGTVTLTPDGSGWTLTAESNDGWKFLYWEDDHANTNPVCTLTIAEAGMEASFEAVFQRVVYNCLSNNEYITEFPESVLPYTSGSIDTASTDGVLSLTATSEEGWKFLYWDDDHDNTNPVRELSNTDFVGGDMVISIDAIFQRVVYNCISDVEYQVEITNPVAPYEYGTIDATYDDGVLYMQVTPTEGNTFVQWADGVYANPRQLEHEGASDTTFYAVFMPTNTRDAQYEWISTPSFDSVRITLDASGLPLVHRSDYEYLTLFCDGMGDGRAIGCENNVTDEYKGVFVVETLPYSAEFLAGKKYHMVFKNNELVPVATMDVTIPYIVTGTETVVVPTTSTPVHVLPGGVATFSEDQIMGALDVYPGGKAIIEYYVNLTASDVVLRADRPNGRGVADLMVKGGLTNSTSDNAINLDYNLNWYQFYAFAVPYIVSTNPYSIRYTSGHSAAERYVLGEYDGAKRAVETSAWADCYNYDKEHGTNTLLENFTRRKGYYIFGDPECWQDVVDENHERHSSYFRFPLYVPNINEGLGERKASIEVNQYASDDITNANWNFVGLPYLTSYNGRIMMYKDDEYVADLKYVIVPEDGILADYSAEEVSRCTLEPFTAFFVQFSEDVNKLQFEHPNPSMRLPASAPKRKAQAVQTPSEVAAGIILAQNGKSDHTAVYISEQYTNNYDVNADLAKMESTSGRIRLFSMLGATKLAYAALPPANGSGTLETVIPLGYESAAVGSTMTFAIDTRRYPELIGSEDVYALELVDYVAGETKDLLEGAYTCTAYQKSDNTRFALNVRYHAPQQQEISTGICCDTPRATALPDGVYDLLGRPVTSSVLPAGAYIIVENGQTRKEVIK